jgi:hypothetical protein
MNLNLGELDVSDNLKMFGRYAIAIAVGWLVGSGKVSPEAGDLLTRFLIEGAGLLIAFVPAIYAAQNVDNSPKP